MTSHADREPVRELLHALLRQADFPGGDELLGQVASVEIVGGPLTMLDLRVDERTAPSALSDGPVPLSLVVSGPDGSTIGELLIWVGNGYLSALEFAWWTDEPPGRLPSADLVQVARR
jgi:hypothetical protein